MIPGISIVLYPWEEIEEDFHARYILTDVGGVRFESGFEEVEVLQNIDLIIMDYDFVSVHNNIFSKNGTAYKLDTPCFKADYPDILKNMKFNYKVCL